MMGQHGIPGAALAVARDGKCVLARGFGWADLATREQVQPDTRFGIASLFNAFTVVAALKLVEEGRLRLDDKAFVLLSHIKPFPGVCVDPASTQLRCANS
jgi:N-acyl-D-amino-acid deacylase